MDHAWSCWMCAHEENLWGNEGNLSSSIWLLIKWHYLIEELDSVHNEFGKGGGREEGNNFTTMILNEAQLSNQAIHKRFICFIAKKRFISRGVIWNYVQLTDEHSPSMIVVHCGSLHKSGNANFVESQSWSAWKSLSHPYTPTWVLCPNTL